MKNFFLPFAIILLIYSCNKKIVNNINIVHNIEQLNKAIANAKSGDEIVLAKGNWKDVKIKFYGIGTADQPIVLRAEIPRETIIEGRSFLKLGGKHLVVDGLYFRNGYSPESSIITYKINEDSTAFYSKVTNCVIEDFNKPSRLTNDRWIEFYGQHNSLDHCYISGKSNDGETLRIFQTGNQHNNNHHQIVHNYFGPRPRKGGPRAETIRVGDSKTHMTPGYVNVSNNYFDGCNGEVEIISDKTNFNSFENNIFYKCEGSLVLRHGSFAKVDGNIFIGGDESDFYGGIRVINTGHWITNNYFYKINGGEFRSPLAIMNGIPKSQLNRYRQVTDVVVAHNTWIDCKSPWQVGVGQNIKSADVLPEVEIRSAPPIRSIVANNLIFNHKADNEIVVNHDKIDGIFFSNNVLDNENKSFAKFDALSHQSLKMKQINDWLFAPEDGQKGLIDTLYKGFDFDKIKSDLFKSSRESQNYAGAISQLAGAEKFEIDKAKYGPSWYVKDKKSRTPNILKPTNGDLASLLDKAVSGDIIELSEDEYFVEKSLKIDKEITIRSKGNEKVQIIFSGTKKSPCFEMNPKGYIRLSNVVLKGESGQFAFAPLNKNMSAAYNLKVQNCEIDNFEFVLKASKGSFADSIYFKNTTIQNCENGFVLAADERGDYNAEMVTFENCFFKNIKQNVIHFFRGGYDESTIGGFLRLHDNNFENCGQIEKSGVLIKTRGIINVLISGNSFKNNPTKFAAILWGIKNNHHYRNTFIKSGKIKVEEQQKLKILY